MEDFQGKYNGKQIEQLLDKANDIDLSKYALKTDNAPTATKLQAARTIVLSGAVSGSVSSDFGSNVTISTTLSNFDASKITSGTIDIDRLPKAALERMVVVADDTARFKLTTATAQVGDTVKVTATNKMYLVKDDSKLNTEDGYEPYTASSASSVPWSGVTGKPSTFAPPTAAASTLGGVKVGYTTSGKNYKLQVDASGNAFVNVPWTDNNTTYNQATADTLGLVKIGYSSSGKNYAVSLDSNGKMYVNVPWTDNNTTYAQATSDKLGLVKIGYSANGKNYPVALDGSGRMYVNVPWTDTNTTYSNMGRLPPPLRERPVWSLLLPLERKVSIFVVMEHGRHLQTPHTVTWVELLHQRLELRDWYQLPPQVNKPLFFVVMARGLSLLIPHTPRPVHRPLGW